MSSKHVMRVGLVGCGGISRAHGTAIAASPLLELVACADFVKEKAATFAKEFEIEHHFASMADMLKNVEVDLVLLATFPANHLKEINEAVALGAKAILCEKALAMSGKEGDEILALARKSGAFIVEGLTYRHHPQIARAKAIIDSGEIGQVTSMQAHFSDFQRGEPDPNNWRTRVELGGGTIAAKGCYLIDAAAYFMPARPVEVMCHTTRYPGRDFDIAQSGTIVFENDAVAQFEASHRGAWHHCLLVHGTEGWIEIPFAVVTRNQPRTIDIVTGTTWGEEAGKRRRETFPTANSYFNQLENVYRSVYEGAPYPMPLEDSIRDLHITDALLESARTRRWVPMKPQ